MKKIFLILLSFYCLSVYSVEFSESPCRLNGDQQITDRTGIDIFENGSIYICDFQASQIQLKIYKIAVCTSSPVFTNGADPDLSSCSNIYDNTSGADVTVSKSSGFNLDNLTKPNSGSYPYVLFLMSNVIKIKAVAHFDGDRETKAGSQGPYCWTNGSTIYPMDPAEDALLRGSGLQCGDTIDQGSYTFNNIEWRGLLNDDTYSTLFEAAPNGRLLAYFLDENLRTVLQGNRENTARWASVYEPNTPISITENTSALKMSIDVTTGAGVRFDPTDNYKLKWIEDAPFGYNLDPVN